MQAMIPLYLSARPCCLAVWLAADANCPWDRPVPCHCWHALHTCDRGHTPASTTSRTLAGPAIGHQIDKTCLCQVHVLDVVSAVVVADLTTCNNQQSSRADDCAWRTFDTRLLHRLQQLAVGSAMQ